MRTDAPKWSVIVVTHSSSEMFSTVAVESKQFTDTRRLEEAEGCGVVTVGHGEIHYTKGARGAA